MSVQRRVVPAVGVNQFAGSQIQHPKPHRNEHAGFVVLAQAVVRSSKHLVGREILAQELVQQSLDAHHEQRCRYALAGYVGYYHAAVILIYQEEVVEVAAHFLCRVHGCR